MWSDTGEVPCYPVPQFCPQLVSVPWICNFTFYVALSEDLELVSLIMFNPSALQPSAHLLINCVP